MFCPTHVIDAGTTFRKNPPKLSYENSIFAKQQSLILKQ